MGQIVLDYVPQPRQLVAHLARAREIFFGGSAGGGKALALDTPIPVPGGWSTMGELRVGDAVFGPDGEPCRVLAISEVFLEDTYRVEFSDGTSVVAGGRHQWVTITADEDNYEGGSYSVRTTDEILRTLRDDDGFPNHYIALDPKERSILAVVPVDQVPIKCIEVDHPTHCYLAGEGMIPTHNSHLLRWDAVDFCVNCPKLTAVIFRRSYPQLVNNHVRPLQRELPQELASWNESHKEFRFYNGSVLLFKHLEHLNALEDIQGWDIHYAGVDEGTHLDPEMLRFIRSRMRLGNYAEYLDRLVAKNPRLKEYRDRLPRTVISSNPGGVSHDYLKQNYIDPAPPETEFEDEYGISKIFIPARMSDNKYLDENYASQFAEMPEWQRRQLVDGDWDTIPGAFFDCWERSRHVIVPFQVPRHWTRFRSMDWGYRTPFSVGWWAVSDGGPVVNRHGDTVVYPEGAMIRYREFYGAKKGQRGWLNQGLRMEPEDLAIRMLDLEAGEDIAYGVADPSIWRADGGPSVAEKMANAGVFWQRAANERASGSTLMYQRIARDMLYSFDTCEAFQRFMPQAETDEKKPEEYKKQGQDHVCFAAGTMVDTESGPKPIETLTSGRVWDGERFTGYTAGLVSESAELVRVTMSDGRRIVCTPDHLFQTTKGWIHAVDLTDEVCYEYRPPREDWKWLQSSLRRFRSFLASGITAAGRIFRETAFAFTGRYGNTSMVPFQMVRISTTGTVTEPTTILPTLNSWMDRITSHYICLSRKAGPGRGEPCTMPERRLVNGTAANKVSNGTASSIGSTVATLWRKLNGLAPVKFVARSSSECRGENTATKTVKLLRFVAVERLREKRPVYCLTVPSSGRFSVSGGVIVHNCDEARYACASRPAVKRREVGVNRGWALPTLDEVLSRRPNATENWL